MKKILGILFLIMFHASFGQEKFTAIVKNEITGLVMPSVHILNLTQVLGTISDQKGSFKIEAKVNDTLY